MYDAECGLCKWLLVLLLGWDRGGRLNPVALQRPLAAELLGDLAQEERMASWHLVSPDGERQRTARAFPTILTKIRRRAPARLRAVLPNDDVSDGEQAVNVGYVIGACQAIRRRALDTVGLLDERIFYGPEDVDLCLRMWKAGWRVVWDPRHVVVHHEQRLTKRRLVSRLTLRHAWGLGYFFLKHRYFLHAPAYGVSTE